MTDPAFAKYEYIEGERSPGVGAGVFALVLSVIPALWVVLFQVVVGMPGTKPVVEGMLAAEPYSFPIVGAVALLSATVALLRNRRAGKLLGAIAILLLVVQVVVILVLV